MNTRSYPAFEYPASLVWAAACAANRINGGYVREAAAPTADGETSPMPNKLLAWRFLLEQENITDEDRALGEAVRLHFAGKIMDIIAGTANDFTKSVATLAQNDVITQRRDVSLISCLPASYERDQRRQALDFVTQPVGKVGERLEFELTVDDQGYSANYNVYWHLAHQGTNRFFFFSSNVFERGKTHKVKARVKSHKEDGTTVLNHVKLTKDK